MKKKDVIEEVELEEVEETEATEATASAKKPWSRKKKIITGVLLGVTGLGLVAGIAAVIKARRDQDALPEGTDDEEAPFEEVETETEEVTE